MSARFPFTRRLPTYLAFVIFLFVLLFPVYIIAVASFTPRGDLLSTPPEYFPETLTLENYRRMADQLPFTSYLQNSLVFAIGSSTLAVAISFLAAYAFARLEFPGRHLLFLTVLLSTTLPQIATVIPLFRLLNRFDLVNTQRGLILLMGSLLAPFTVWVMTSFIKQVPREIEEAARLDGANLIRVMFGMVAPLALPAIATLFLINFIITWNELFFPLIFATKNDVKPMTLGLVELSTGATGAGKPWDLMSALAMVMIVPAVLLVTVFQRVFVRGLTQGAVK
jgi:ABC-type glycerol-3-phosphate transport system permease component